MTIPMSFTKPKKPSGALSLKNAPSMHNTGRPVLVGTTSIEKSEVLSRLLHQLEIPHQLLNAKPENVERESEIVAQAGRKGAVTIATNMAGRGTDIILGGNSDYMARLKIREYLMPRIVAPEDDGNFSPATVAAAQQSKASGTRFWHLAKKPKPGKPRPIFSLPKSPKKPKP